MGEPLWSSAAVAAVDRPPMPPPADQDSERVHEDLAARHRAVGKAVEQTSGIPLAMFAACDPMIEAKLIEDAMQLLTQMTVDAALLPTSPPPDVAANVIEPADVEALLRDVTQDVDDSLPDLLGGSAVERLWVLLDIAVVGNGLARQRATAQLREAMQDLRRCEGLETPHLKELASMLGSVDSDDMSLLFQTLQLATRSAFEQQERAARQDQR